MCGNALLGLKNVKSKGCVYANVCVLMYIFLSNTLTYMSMHKFHNPDYNSL